MKASLGAKKLTLAEWGGLCLLIASLYPVVTWYSYFLTRSSSLAWDSFFQVTELWACHAFIALVLLVLEMHRSRATPLRAVRILVVATGLMAAQLVGAKLFW